jgi:hypothetical protein
MLKHETLIEFSNVLILFKPFTKIFEQIVYICCEILNSKLTLVALKVPPVGGD